jgi:hypothetical protein
VVAIEHRACLVAGDLHRDALGHAGVNHVPQCRPAEIMSQAPCAARLIAGRGPRLPEIAAAFAAALTSGEEREEIRDDSVGSLLECFNALELRRQENPEVRRQVNNAPLIILRRAGVQAQRPSLEVELPPLERQNLVSRCYLSPRDGASEIASSGCRASRPAEHPCWTLAGRRESSVTAAGNGPLKTTFGRVIVLSALPADAGALYAWAAPWAPLSSLRAGACLLDSALSLHRVYEVQCRFADSKRGSTDA